MMQYSNISTLILLSFLLISCEATTRYWYKPQGSNINEMLQVKSQCLLNSQQRVETTENDRVMLVNGNLVTFPGSKKNEIITNNSIFDACMNANGYFLTENLELVNKSYSIK